MFCYSHLSISSCASHSVPRYAACLAATRAATRRLAAWRSALRKGRDAREDPAGNARGNGSTDWEPWNTQTARGTKMYNGSCVYDVILSLEGILNLDLPPFHMAMVQIKLKQGDILSQ